MRETAKREASIKATELSLQEKERVIGKKAHEAEIEFNTLQEQAQDTLDQLKQSVASESSKLEGLNSHVDDATRRHRAVRQQSEELNKELYKSEQRKAKVELEIQHTIARQDTEVGNYRDELAGVQGKTMGNCNGTLL